MAIKVSGTNVITDGRALNNITSIDTTTKNAIGNAGVGGATSQITNWTNIPTSTNFTISLSSSYDIIKIFFDRVGVNNQQFSVDFQTRFQYSGGTETGYDYIYHEDSATGGSNKTENYWFLGPIHGSGTTNPTKTSGVIEIRFHAESSRQLQFSWQGTTRYDDSSANMAWTRHQFGTVYNPSASTRTYTGINFSNNYAPNVVFNSGQYMVMGVNL